MAEAGGEKPSWAITKVAATGTIWLRFVGPTRSSECPEFIRALNEMMPDEDANVVFDLRALEGHNPDTKEPIKTWLRDNKARIDTVTVIVPKSGAILKMVIAVISLATGVKIHIRDDSDEAVSVANL
ncbi:MAG TPA: hypothetical protein VHV51_18365 [Polyangiaceae bacterium]|jgi:hypothetical protein|nr:hypothetical protein [Polyangiaceae bacterium]